MSATVGDPLVGQLVDGRYHLDELIAVGGMAAVYRATDRRLERAVAIKVMRAEYADDPDFISRFQDEARAAARLSHPNVVSIYDQGRSNDLVYLAMEYVPGRTLRHVLRAQGRLTASQALAVCDQVLQALAAAHQAGFIHRDIKPENVLVSPTGAVKVTDFGLARALASPSNRTKGMLIGTAAYLAPEHVSTSSSDERSDIYQAGILLYEMVSGTVPHTGDTAWSVAYSHVNTDVPLLRSVAPHAPAELERIVRAATDRSPQRRIPTVASFLAAVRHLAMDLPPAEPFRQAENETIVVGSDAEPGTTHLLPDDSDPGATAAAAGAAAGAAVAQSTSPRAPDRLSVFDFVAPDSDSGAHDHPAPVNPEEPAGASQDDVGEGGDGTAAGGGRRRWWWLVAPIVIALLGVTGWATGYNPFDRTDVPDMRGVPLTRAQNALESIGLESVVSERQYSERIEADRVLRTDPVAGSSARTGSTVGLIISRGPERYAVPKVRGMTPEAATASLQNTHLAVGDERASHSDEIPIGSVVRTKPKRGTEVRRDAGIDLVLSKGPAPVDVPHVEGMSIEDAEEALDEAGLNHDITDRKYSDTVPDGGVVAVNPRVGARVQRTDTVDLTLSKGPPPVTVPNLVDMQREEAERRLRELGLTVRISEGVVTPLNRVFSQDPSPGTQIPRGSTVTLSVF